MIEIGFMYPFLIKVILIVTKMNTKRKNIKIKYMLGIFKRIPFPF